ncbi:2-keto-3-deoxygluconate permease [Pelosinus sp. UFO1]|uniref:2-keto-3-deoxygluconate permease n=1 Tax=Pelosinus sp. UFO1 TaxID=484770 RepID=UPI0004D0D30D|nr:2-keto-3-deoxygluconate permease [Pelosinus sp. UFO1]AIF52549.1 2-keto-3-deoxygluconate permease [Pelosinus sp. UFO1]
MKVLSNVKKIPGGVMVVPLLLGAIVNTFFPQVLDMGGYMTGVFSNKGAQSLVGVSFLFAGSQLRLKSAPEAFKRGSVLLAMKFITGIVFGMLVAKLFGMDGFWGISVIAIISALTSGNGGLYMALVSEYGDDVDLGAMSVLAIKSGPFMALIALGASGMATIPMSSLIAAIAPMIVGVILGNMDEDLRKLLGKGVEPIIPCFAFTLGAGVNLMTVIQGGISGIILGFIMIVCGALPALLADRWICRRPGYAGIATAGTAGISMATPAAIALADPSMQQYVAASTIQLATAVLLTAVVVPMVTKFVVKRYGSGKEKQDTLALQS